MVVERELSRTRRLRGLVLAAPYEVCIERARYVTEVYRAGRGLHPSVRAARAFECVLRNMSIRILDDEVIAGNTTGKVVGTLLPVERGELNLVMEVYLDQLERRERRPYRVDAADRRELLEDILPFWRGRTVRDGKLARWRREGLYVMPGLSPRGILDRLEGFGALGFGGNALRMAEGSERHIFRALRELPLNNPGLVNNVMDVQGHLIVGHRNVIATGFSGVRERALEGLRAGGLGVDGRRFLEGVVICCDAARMFAGRYARMAEDLAGREERPGRREELLGIARAAGRVPWLPPRSFREAVQSLWLTQVMACISSGMVGICAVGRPDQYLFSFYERDVREGVISRGEALELVEELLVKLATNLICLPSFVKDTASEFGADSMAVTIGGLGEDGEDATNELSFVFLDAVANMEGIANSYSVRVSGKTGADFLERVAEVHAVTSGVALFNDDVVIPALVGTGCGLGHARDYGIIGCVEPSPQGNAFPCTSGNDVSLVGVLEMALNDGRLRMMGRRMGVRTGDPAGFESFDDLMGAFGRQLRHVVGFIARCVNAKDEVYMRGFHNPFLSATIEGCVEGAEDVTCGGAVYNYGSIVGRGLATVADSLAAVKRFVYEEGRVSMGELVEALRVNWRGYEPLRVMLESRGPRYGADDDGADEIARVVAGMFCDEVSRHRSVRKGGVFRPGFFSYGLHVFDGTLLAATPDGRAAGRPVSNSVSPSNGAERLGPTATLRSVAKLDHLKISNGCSLNMKLMPSMLRSAEGRGKFVSMVRGYFALGGMHVQFNVVDNRTLRDAQLHPERYRGLVVRVSGYSALFTDLGRSIQDDLIRRTEFSGF